MTTVHRIALLGFSAFERNTLGSYFRLASTREPRYEQVQMLPEADFVVADADHEPAVKLVLAVERLPETVFVGARAPEGAIAWLPRPIDPMRVLRELDVMANRRMSQPGAAVRDAARHESADCAARRRTVIQPVRPQRPDAPAELLRPPAEALDLTLPDLPDPRHMTAPPDLPQHAKPAAPEPGHAGKPALAAALIPRPPVLQGGPAPTLRLPAQQAVAVAPAEPAAHVAPVAPVAPVKPAALVAPPAMPVAAAPDVSADSTARAATQATLASKASLTSVVTLPSVWTVRAAHAAAGARSVNGAEAAAPAAPMPAPAAQTAHTARGEHAAHPARAVASMPASAGKPAAPRQAGPSARLSPLAVGAPPSAALLVDDSELALRFLQKRLATFGLQTDCASHSEAAIKLMAERRYDFVFLDMELGEQSALDGLSLCQRIKESSASANVVMVTAHHTELDRVRGALAGCDGFLGKPLDEDELALYLARFGVRPAAHAGHMPS